MWSHRIACPPKIQAIWDQDLKSCTLLLSLWLKEAFESLLCTQVSEGQSIHPATEILW